MAELLWAKPDSERTANDDGGFTEVNGCNPSQLRQLTAPRGANKLGGDFIITNGIINSAPSPAI